jgi:hypothetical protein
MAFNFTTFLQTLTENTTDQFKILDTIQAQEASKIIAPEQWTILEHLEHCYIVENSVNRLMRSSILQESETEEVIGNEKLKKIIVDWRARKVKSPETMLPKGNLHSVEKYKLQLFDLRRTLSEDLESGNIIITNKKLPHPYLGEMTMSDWLYFIVHHSKRHFLTIEEILKSLRAK